MIGFMTGLFVGSAVTSAVIFTAAGYSFLREWKRVDHV